MGSDYILIQGQVFDETVGLVDVLKEYAALCGFNKSEREVVFAPAIPNEPTILLQAYLSPYRKDTIFYTQSKRDFGALVYDAAGCFYRFMIGAAAGGVGNYSDIPWYEALMAETFAVMCLAYSAYNGYGAYDPSVSSKFDSAMASTKRRSKLARGPAVLGIHAGSVVRGKDVATMLDAYSEKDVLATTLYTTFKTADGKSVAFSRYKSAYPDNNMIKVAETIQNGINMRGK